MAPTIHRSFDLRTSRCIHLPPRSGRMITADAIANRSSTNRSGGRFEFSPNLMMGTLVPKSNPATRVDTSPFFCPNSLQSGREPRYFLVKLCYRYSFGTIPESALLLLSGQG